MPRSIEALDLPHIDVLASEYELDPTSTLRAAREQGAGMMTTHRGVEFLTCRWVETLVNHPAFHTVDARHFAQKGAPESLVEFAENGLLLSMTGEQHDRIRRVLLKAFALRRIDQNRSVMSELAHARVDAFVRSGTCDLVADFTEPYPMEVLCRLIGIPTSDLDHFVGAAREMHLMAEVPMAPGFERIDRALQTMRNYVVELVERRRRDPQDDLLTGVVEAEHTEGKLTAAELVGNMINVLFAGGGTTRFQLASALRLAIELDLWESLAEDARLIQGFVEESMRYRPVTQFVVRIPDDDVVIDDLLFPARRRIILNLEAASRDPDAFPDPDRFDIERSNLSRSRLPFGWGMHFCLGAALSRAAMGVAIETLTSALCDVRVADEVAMSPARGMLRGPDRLPITFARTEFGSKTSSWRP
jgi:cytochrome P450